MESQTCNPAQFESWEEFVVEWTPLLSRVARRASHSQDDAMDAYAYILERLSEKDCRRLRAYSISEGAKFSTWLTRVAKRLCIDHQRRCYGRSSSNRSLPSSAFEVRRSLYLMNEVVSPDELPDSTADFAFQDVESREIRIALASLLDELSPIEKRLLFLRFCQGLTAREISGRVGFSTAFHVYRSLDSVLKKLRFALAAKGYDGFRLVDDVA